MKTQPNMNGVHFDPETSDCTWLTALYLQAIQDWEKFMKRIAVLAAALALTASPMPLLAQEAQTDDTLEMVELEWGDTLNIPPQWNTDFRDGSLVLTPPEGDAEFVVARIEGQTDGGEAVAQAWLGHDPDFDRTVRLVQDAPGRNGWDKFVSVSYETSPNEKMFLLGQALQSGESWTVILGRGALATVAKRGAQLNQSLGSLRPGGYDRESFAEKEAHTLDADRIEAIKTFVADAMKTLDIPGVGLALIDDGRIVYEGGLGTREKGKDLPVDEHTRFFIASNTKGMATLLLSTLVDEGKVGWKDKVIDLYPDFRLGSDETTESVLIEHLVCACTGLPRKDMQLIFNTRADTPASDTFVQLAATEPTSGFGEVFQYNNLMASAAGYIAGALINPGMEVGAAFDMAMNDRIFAPLGMDNSGFGINQYMATDYAAPHSEGYAGVSELAPLEWNHIFDPFRPAGGAYSTAHDMALYVQNELAEGGDLFGKENIVARRLPHIATGEDSWYGMGLQGDDRYGVEVFSHGGSLIGYKSNFWFIPEAGVGAVLLTNSDSGQMLLGPFSRFLLETLYDGKPEAVENISSVAERAAKGRERFRKDLSKPGDPDVIAGLANRYFNEDLGPIIIESDTRISVTSGSADYVTRANEDGTHSIVIATPGLFGFPLVVAEKDGKRALILRDAQHEFVFVEDEG